MKKIAPVALTIGLGILIPLLAGCGEKEEVDEEKTSAAASPAGEPDLMMVERTTAHLRAK